MFKHVQERGRKASRYSFSYHTLQFSPKLFVDTLKKKEEEEEFNEPGGLLFGEEPPPPGQKRQWEEWEAPWYTVLVLVTFFGFYGLYQRPPDTSYVSCF